MDALVGLTPQVARSVYIKFPQNNLTYNVLPICMHVIHSYMLQYSDDYPNQIKFGYTANMKVVTQNTGVGGICNHLIHFPRWLQFETHFTSGLCVSFFQKINYNTKVRILY